MLRAAKSAILRGALAMGYRIEKVSLLPPSYDSDGLTVRGKYAPFLDNRRFISAYRSAMDEAPYEIEWRIAVTCWAAQHGAHLPGDFVECGTNLGYLSRAICEYLDFNTLPKSFYLFDTFRGIPHEQLS